MRELGLTDPRSQPRSSIWRPSRTAGPNPGARLVPQYCSVSSSKSSMYGGTCLVGPQRAVQSVSPVSWLPRLRAPPASRHQLSHGTNPVRRMQGKGMDDTRHPYLSLPRSYALCHPRGLAPLARPCPPRHMSGTDSAPLRRGDEPPCTNRLGVRARRAQVMLANRKSRLPRFHCGMPSTPACLHGAVQPSESGRRAPAEHSSKTGITETIPSGPGNRC